MEILESCIKSSVCETLKSPVMLWLYHWFGYVILMKFSTLAAPEVFKMTTSDATSDKHFAKTTFPFLRCVCLYILVYMILCPCSRGQCGHGDTKSRTEPEVLESLEGLSMNGIAAGGWHSVAISGGFMVMNALIEKYSNKHWGRDTVGTISQTTMNEKVWTSIKISLKFVRKGSINHIPALVQIMAWRHPGDKPLS